MIESMGQTDQHQVIGRLDVGSILTSMFSKVPYNLRFFAGGDQSIRGYDYKSLSAQEDGYLIGGQQLAVGSLEYSYRFKPKWRGAVFVDAGNAFDQHFNDPIKVGAGVGVRWASPIGPIRLDVAAGISEASVPIRLHFFIGPPL
jgi:translocation and assembly module TamA